MTTESLIFHTVDVFTTKRFAGNPLAIVEGADGLATEAMLTITREFNLSETIFVQTPDDPSNTAKVRIFFPAAEIPFAGHPTIGCAIHLAQKAHRGAEDFDDEIVLEEVAGLVPVKVQRRNGVITAQFTAPVIPFAGEGELPDAELAAAALGISKADIGFGNHSIGLYQGGPSFLFVPIGSHEALAAARPCEPAWSQMMEIANSSEAYIYTPRNDGHKGFQARMFAPGAGIPEDPATGSASAILAAQLLDAGALQDGLNEYELLQGYEMGRPSDIGLEVDVNDGAISAVRVSGSSVPVATGTIQTAPLA